jgi:TldD protein
MQSPLHFIFQQESAGWEFPDSAELIRVGECVLQRGADFVEFYAEKHSSNLITLSENKIGTARQKLRQGVGVRVIQGIRTGYAYCESMKPVSIRDAAQRATNMIGINSHQTVSDLWKNEQKTIRGNNIFYPIETKVEEKADLLRRANFFAQEADARIHDVTCTYYDEEKEIQIVNSHGINCRDRRSLISFHVTVLAKEKNKQSASYNSGGGSYPFEYFKTRTPERIAKDAVDQALRKLDARECPAGLFPVVIHRGWGGVLIHEAVGHGLEGDYHRKGSSIYSGRLGQKVASDLVTIVDDGTLAHGRGTMHVDDEGTHAQKNVLIENGILKNYMYDTLNARLMNTQSTGNGRRENYTQAPMPRMTNTYIAAGEDDPEEIIRSVKSGLFAKSLGGGQVDIVSGNFVFEVQEGYWIEDGKIAYPVHGANLIGHGADILNKIVAVGNDLEIETGMGHCGKDGQTIPVCVGQPTIKIGEMTVGGTLVRS